MEGVKGVVRLVGLVGRWVEGVFQVDLVGRWEGNDPPGRNRLRAEAGTRSVQGRCRIVNALRHVRKW